MSIRHVLINILIPVPLLACTVAVTDETPMGHEQQTGVATAPASIVIQSLHVDRIESLTVNLGAPTVPPSTTVTPPAPSAAAWQRKYVIDRQDFADADLDDPRPGRGLDIYIFDVGQADAMLVVGPTDGGRRKTLLIDMGESKGPQYTGPEHAAVADKIRRILRQQTPTLDYFVATHFHEDHVGNGTNGIVGLIEDEHIAVHTVIDVGMLSEQQFNPDLYMAPKRGTFEKYQEAMGRISPQVHEAPRFGSDQIVLGGGVQVEILAFAGLLPDSDGDGNPESVLEEVRRAYPTQYQKAPASENDLSVAMEISLGQFELFTGGDLSGAVFNPAIGSDLFSSRFKGTYTNVERRMVDGWRNSRRESDVEIYRANHHGSEFSTTDSLLAALDPEFVIYSCGGGYEHPHPSVCDRVAQTAWQYVTGALSRKAWPRDADFEALKGEILGNDIVIQVNAAGTWYHINDELHKAFSEAEEAQGDDVDEELIQRRPEDD